MTIAFNIWKKAKRTTSKLMRYVTLTVIQPFSYIAALLFLCCFSCINPSHSVSRSAPLFPLLSLTHINFDVASPCTVDGSWEP